MLVPVAVSEVCHSVHALAGIGQRLPKCLVRLVCNFARLLLGGYPRAQTTLRTSFEKNAEFLAGC